MKIKLGVDNYPINDSSFVSMSEGLCMPELTGWEVVVRKQVMKVMNYS